MRAGIPSKATRLHTVTLYINKEPFKRALGIDTEDTIYLFLVGRDGTVHWSGTGDFDGDKGKGLKEALERLEGLTGPARS